jgi:hypothetical protein
MAAAAKADLDPVVPDSFGMQPFRDSGVLEYLDRSLFEHARADAAEHVVGAAPFEHDGIDRRALQ